MPPALDKLADEDFCYLTTVGRVTGRPHEIEIWFAIENQILYMLSGGQDRSDWVKNLHRHPQAEVRIGDERFEGRARSIESAAEDELARSLLVEKYDRVPGTLTHWRNAALPVAVDLEV